LRQGSGADSDLPRVIDAEPLVDQRWWIVGSSKPKGFETTPIYTGVCHKYHGTDTKLPQSASKHGGRGLPAARNVQTLIPHIFMNATEYESRVVVKCDFLSVTLFIIDLAVQTHLQ
jgi:hypothetical protein